LHGDWFRHCKDVLLDMLPYRLLQNRVHPHVLSAVRYCFRNSFMACHGRDLAVDHRTSGPIPQNGPDRNRSMARHSSGDGAVLTGHHAWRHGPCAHGIPYDGLFDRGYAVVQLDGTDDAGANVGDPVVVRSQAIDADSPGAVVNRSLHTLDEVLVERCFYIKKEAGDRSIAGSVAGFRRDATCLRLMLEQVRLSCDLRRPLPETAGKKDEQ